MPDFTIPTRPGIALLLGAFNTALAFIVGAKTTDSGLDPVTVFYMACALAVMGWVLLHIVPSKGEPAISDAQRQREELSRLLSEPPPKPASAPVVPDQAEGLRAAVSEVAPTPPQAVA